MEMKTIKLLFENEDFMKLVSKFLDEDTAFLYSLLRLAGYNECSKGVNINLGIVQKDKK